MQQERISKIMGISMVIVAFCVDLFEMLLEWMGIGIMGFSTLISVCASVGFWIWFKMYGVSFGTSPRKFGTYLTTSVLEVIPGLDAIGGLIWTIGIAATVYMVRMEDKGHGIISMKASVNRIRSFKVSRRSLGNIVSTPNE